MLTLTSDVAPPPGSPKALARSKLVGNQIVFEKAFAVALTCMVGILAAPAASGAIGTAAAAELAKAELADGDDDEARFVQQVGDTVTGAVENVGNATNGSGQTAQRTILWMEQQVNRVEHIMAPKHAWNRLANLTGSSLDNYRSIQPYIEQQQFPLVW